MTVLNPTHQPMYRSTNPVFTARVNAFFHRILYLVYRPRARRSNVQGEVPVTHISDASTFGPPSSSTLPTKITESRHDLARQLQRLLPPTCNWLSSSDVRIIDTTPFSSGGFAEVWKGSVQGLTVAVKSLRCYSSTEIDPAEVGIVSPHLPAHLI